MGVDLFSKELGRVMTVINIYEPYINRLPLWDNLHKKYFIKDKMVILRGDLNLSLGAAEIWGPKAIPNPMVDFFVRSFV